MAILINNLKMSGIMLLLGLFFICFAQARISDKDDSRQSSTATIDFGTWINANKLLMFVTNKGSFAFDNSGTLAKSDGLYYPYTGMDDITTGRNTLTAIFAGSIWIGAEVAAKHDPSAPAAVGDTLVTSGQHSTDWSPGPLDSGGDPPADATTNPVYRVYKLHRDSLADNPNWDYLYWPVDQGAPVTAQGVPAMIGDQMLWSVYNDMDIGAHQNAQGSAGKGLGIEVQQTVWAVDEDGIDTLLVPTTLRVYQAGGTRIHVAVNVVDGAALTGHDYRVVIDSGFANQGKWHLIDVTTGETKLADQTNFLGGESPVVDGFTVQVTDPGAGFSEFAIVANATGPLSPHAAGAFDFQGFPTPNRENPGDGTDQQPGQWAIHTADNGGSCDGGERGSYEAFLSRVTRDGNNLSGVGNHDYEMRFTGSNASPGVNGGYAIEAFKDDNVFWVPFELWDIGVATPNDASDDVRLIPFVIDDGDDDTYNLESWGCVDSAIFGGDGEHSASGADNDPWTDWVYWYTPTDMSAGQAGYLANEADMIGGGYDYSLIANEVMARTVLISWNGGEQPPFAQDLPEVGTVFRISTGKDSPVDTFSFTADPPVPVTSGPEGVSVYLSFKMYNKGPYDLENTFISIWTDPDLGDASDDLVGCDTLTDVHYCYNEGEDAFYGSRPPAVGFKLLDGPLVSSPGDTAQFEGSPVLDYKNLGMTAFSMFLGGLDPDSPTHTYWYMNGLTTWLQPLIDPTTGETTKYYGNGDPVTGTGFLDRNASDRRMMAHSGPFTFNKGDSQFVMVKLAVGQGADALSSLTRLREILNAPYDFPTAIDDEPRTALPGQYTLAQNYPNPFNPTTTIEYNLPRRAHVNIEIFNLLGQRVQTLVDREESAGSYSVIWNGKDAGGRSVATGIYLYRIRAGDHVETKKMLLLK